MERPILIIASGSSFILEISRIYNGSTESRGARMVMCGWLLGWWAMTSDGIGVSFCMGILWSDCFRVILAGWANLSSWPKGTPVETFFQTDPNHLPDTWVCVFFHLWEGSKGEPKRTPSLMLHFAGAICWTSPSRIAGSRAFSNHFREFCGESPRLWGAHALRPFLSYLRFVDSHFQP